MIAAVSRSRVVAHTLTANVTPTTSGTKTNSERRNEMEMTPTPDSSIFTHHGYQDGEIYLTFRQGGATHAYPLTPEQYEDFKAAKSAGQWYHANIRGKKIEGRKVQHAQAV
jgi:hypothetical protein